MINKILKEYMESRGDDIFINYNNNDITYENMAYAVEGKIKSMQAVNIEKNTLVGLYMENPLDLLEILFSCIEIQAIPLIIPGNLTIDEINNLDKSVKLDYIMTTWDKLNNFEGSKIPVISIEDLSSGMGGCAPSIKNDTNYEQIACLLLTSGTTGTPKIAQITINNIIESCNSWNKRIDFKKNDIYLNCLPVHHIGGLTIIFRGLLFGFKIIIMDQFDYNDCIKKIKKYNTTLISLVPTMLYRIIESSESVNLHKYLRAVILSGSYCKPELIKRAISKKINIYKSYGMTESCSGISGFWVKDNLKYINSVGTAHDKVKLKIHDDYIFVHGPSVIEKYFNMEKIGDWYNTNDIGYINKDGFLYVLNRANHAISGGENIDIKEVEQVLCSHPNVKKVFIKIIEDEEWGQQIIAYIRSNDIDENELKAWLKRKVSNYKIPKEFIFINDAN